MADIINALFEFMAGLFVLNHCRVLLKDKFVGGVSLISVCFFVLWGFWNLFYYPHLDQLWSFYGGILIAVANFIWVILIFKYQIKPSKGNVNV